MRYGRIGYINPSTRGQLILDPLRVTGPIFRNAKRKETLVFQETHVRISREYIATTRSLKNWCVDGGLRLKKLETN